MFCTVLKSHRKADTYLYIPKDAILDDLPANLVELFTPHTVVTTLHLKPERKLARLRAPELIKHLETDGFYLQLPPTQADLLALHKSQQQAAKQSSEESS
ncbi:YcgL domain-containing protein [Aliidiomarina maris]|uniref:YcgL domain-containing protein B0I24_101454 n=1 Tax=Aliidiomarina maris TaxID=531312 RepID=A0A327X4J3_9GAMM|nr:YcgL domain-containing protein [Aliidiomarina maris]MBA3988208.1 hypothetical protein [Idiomarina sp.]MCL5050027.1 YcgL domain-containing protein [Bacillota bacterium]RAK01815.1 hypothetical protein B0I24_101454 [Aliidiomarina maris]RUO28626.1 hypothetical protein CWE07_02200 [Aliidiomarina maris]